MKKSQSNGTFRSAFRAIYYLPVVAFVLFIVYYSMGVDPNPVKSRIKIEAKTQSAIQKPPSEIEQEIRPELEAEPEPVTELDREEQVSVQNNDRGPLKELIPTDAQSQLFYEAEEALVQTCMNERGFEYIPNNPNVTKTEREKLEPIPPKPGDIQAAQTRGYGIAESIELDVSYNEDSKEGVNSGKEIKAKDDKTDPEADPNSELLKNLSPEQQQAWNEAFFGRMEDEVESPDVEGSIMTIELPSLGGKIHWDSNSCLSNARREIYGSSMNQMESLVATQELVNQIATAASQDAEYQSALDQWRSCMLSHDLSYQNPGEAAAALYDEYSEGKLDIDALQKKEIHYAGIEAACSRQYSLGDVYKTAEQRAEAKIRETEADQINDLYVEFQNALIMAERYAPHPEEELYR
jgi:hypothetical protein